MESAFGLQSLPSLEPSPKASSEATQVAKRLTEAHALWLERVKRHGERVRAPKRGDVEGAILAVYGMPQLSQDAQPCQYISAREC